MSKRPSTNGSKRHLESNDGQPVEARLLEQKKKYELNMEAKKRDRIMEELNTMREAPEINPLSDLLA